MSITLANQRKDLSPATLALTYGYYPFTGNNSGYKGAFKVLTAFSGYEIGGTQTLGDPETPKAAALVLNNNCFVNIASAQTAEKQCATRGIQLAGDTGYINVKSGTPTLLYAISKAEGATGTCIKSGAGTLTFEGAYTAGDLVVSNGTFVLGADATFPAGQRFVVKDGATLQITAGTGLTTHTIEKEGSGQVVYPEGWRLTSAGVWEAKVAVSAVGGGSVSATEIWTAPGVTQTVTATPDAGNFVIWSGDTAAIQSEGHNVFANVITLKVDGPLTLTATFADLAAAKPTDFSDTGVTGTFANRTLTINADEGATCTYDYASTLTSGWVTNVVKTGAGALTTVAAAGYFGSFDFQAGSVTVVGAGHLGADNVGIVRFSKDAATTIGAGAATGKKAYLAGTINLASSATAFDTCDVVLTDDLTWRRSGGFYLLQGSHVEMNGKSMTLNQTTGWGGDVRLEGVTVTNSRATASSISCAWSTTLYLGSGTTFWGGSQNKVITSANYAEPYASSYDGAIGGDWTYQCKVERFYVRNPTTTGNTLNDKFSGPFEVANGSTKYNYKADKTSCLTFGGPLTGTSSMNVRGGTLNFLNAANTYNGDLTMTDECTPYIRACIYLWNGANFSAKSVTLKNADIWMDDNTAFAFPAITLGNGTKAANCCTISGGPTGDKACGRATIAGFTKSGGNTLTVDSPVHITGTTLVSTNTLALGSGTTANELPVFDHLSFANGTTFDMNGKDLTIGNLTGIPTVTNPGTLTITGNWTVDGDALADGGKLNLGAGALTFGPAATITITKGTKSVPHSVAIACAAGGITGSPTAGAGGAKRIFKVAQSGTELQANVRGMVLVFR